MNNIHRLPLRTYGTWRDVPRKTVREIISLYAEGNSARAISKLFQCDKGAIVKILQKNGVTIRLQRKILSPQEKEFIISEYANGASSYEIKKSVNRDTSVITKVLKEAGISIRNHHKSGEESHNWKGGVSKNREYCNARAVKWMSDRKKTDSLFKIKAILRSRILSFFTRATLAKELGLKKSHRSVELLGANWDVIKKHIEEQFLPGMTWENHGRYGWHFDHIKPLALAETEAELIALFHYTNLQPLWAKDNHAKGSLHNGVRLRIYRNHKKNTGGTSCL